mgnify:CR=1 FL=1
MKNKFNKENLLKKTILILPAIIFISLITFNSLGNNQEKDQNTFEYNEL